MTKTNFYKYFVNTKKDLETEFYILNTGNLKVPPHSDYPLKGHPDTHYFSWGKGRFLKEYQMVFITNGYGRFESRHGGRYNIEPGTLLFIFPNEWHRYRPDYESGWEEYWVGFRGLLAEKMINALSYNINEPVFFIKNLLQMQNLFQELLSYGKEERPGCQQIMSGLVMQVLGQINFSVKNENLIGKPIEDKINKARLLMNEKIGETIDLKDLANQLNISYSLFRKRFKEYTGVSPLQYYLHLKIKHAQDMLLNTSISIKAVADEAGFEDLHYFSKAFRKITGYSPSNFRKSEVI